MEENFNEEAIQQDIKERRERQMVFRSTVAPQRSAENIQKVMDHKAKYDFEL